MRQKPMVPLFGKPMIGVLIETLMKCGAGRICVGANARMQQLLDYLEGLKGEGLPVEVRPIITDNSYCTLKAASEGIEGKFIAMTCDAIFPTDEFKTYVKAVAEAPADTALMGLTRFVEDESPLYARISESGEVTDYRYGGEPFAEGTVVSAGLYGLSGGIMGVIPELGLEPASLSDFQRLLAVKTPVKVMPYEFTIAFDVANTRDRLHAEEFLGQYR
ncbi:MAG: hypothetical protein K2L00_04960, partial [Muribaculaceae bacterium]|nr:hypothetical protein [Muribaculaceae bacterium]